MLTNSQAVLIVVFIACALVVIWHQGRTAGRAWGRYEGLLGERWRIVHMLRDNARRFDQLAALSTGEKSENSRRAALLFREFAAHISEEDPHDGA